jgi:CHAT domain-containing protein
MDGSGRYVAETRRITYAPSASVLVRCVEAARARPKGTDENLLAVGDPTFDPKRFVERLQPLDDAVREVNAVREYYSRASLVLTGPEATETRISAALQTCDVAHLSVHTLVSEKTPWLAAIILASPTGESDAIDPGGANRAEDQIFSATDGLMYLEEIYKLRLLRARLVVLAACQSGLGKYYRGEGMVSLVRPFLAARVPLVVASLWPVDSRATADLMIDFHRRRRIDGERTSEALRNAQSAMAGGPPPFNHPYYWAAFIAVGSDD